MSVRNLVLAALTVCSLSAGQASAWERHWWNRWTEEGGAIIMTLTEAEFQAMRRHGLATGLPGKPHIPDRVVANGHVFHYNHALDHIGTGGGGNYRKVHVIRLTRQAPTAYPSAPVTIAHQPAPKVATMPAKMTAPIADRPQ